MVWFFLMTKNYKKLAKHTININGNTFSSEEELIEIMKQRTKQFSKEKLVQFAQ
jgi:hypothetical protein